MATWVLRVRPLVKRFKHNGHIKGFSPVCMRKCSLTWSFFLKERPHALHAYRLVARAPSPIATLTISCSASPATPTFTRWGSNNPCKDQHPTVTPRPNANNLLIFLLTSTSSLNISWSFLFIEAPMYKYIFYCLGLKRNPNIYKPKFGYSDVFTRSCDPISWNLDFSFQGSKDSKDKIPKYFSF